ncbi:MAG: YbaN family protein [Ruminococcus sp.]|nr:YbaN family protein [Ruminococcus sp.]
MKKIFYIILAIIFLIIGLIGLALPIIPQIPFLILSCFFFTKSSKRFDKWFHNNKFYKKYLSHHFEKKKTKENKK